MIEIDTRSYVDSADAFESANRAAAHAHEQLLSALAGCGAMAGDASVAAEFAGAYDDAADAALSAVAGLVDAFATCGRLTSASLDNHGRAENRSVISGRTVYSGSGCPDGFVAVLPASLPSALGGDPSGIPGWANWVLDQVEGFVWPDADTGLLREAADAWCTAAHRVGGLDRHCRTAVASFERLRAPEVPDAVAVAQAMAARCHRVADQCDALATACEQYADHVESQRAAVLDLVHDLIRDTVIIQGAGLLLGTVTFGTTAAGAAAVNAARIAAAAPRFLRILETLRTLAAAAAAPLKLAASTLRDVRGELAVFRNARTTLASTHSAARLARLERVRGIVRHPRLLEPADLRGLSRSDIRSLCEGWPVRPASEGMGVKYMDPLHRGRQIRVMDGYPPGSRPDPETWGPYAVVSQNGKDPVKVLLLGNPAL